MLYVCIWVKFCTSERLEGKLLWFKKKKISLRLLWWHTLHLKQYSWAERDFSHLTPPPLTLFSSHYIYKGIHPYSRVGLPSQRENSHQLAGPLISLTASHLSSQITGSVYTGPGRFPMWPRARCIIHGCKKYIRILSQLDYSKKKKKALSACGNVCVTDVTE